MSKVLKLNAKHTGKKSKRHSDSITETFSGIKFDILKPREKLISIVDIVHALSNQCRYGGHCRKFFSVSEHSVLVSQIVEDILKAMAQDGMNSIDAYISKTNQQYIRMVSFAALLHDASEGYLVDIPTPVKNHLDNYKEIEMNLMKVILKNQKVSFAFYALPDVIKYADHFALKIEASYLAHSGGADWDSFKGFEENPLAPMSNYKIRCLRPRQAERWFKMRYEQLRQEENFPYAALAYYLGKVLPI